jgi:hypothetical protein
MSAVPDVVVQHLLTSKSRVIHLPVDLLAVVRPAIISLTAAIRLAKGHNGQEVHQNRDGDKNEHSHSEEVNRRVSGKSQISDHLAQELRLDAFLYALLLPLIVGASVEEQLGVVQSTDFVGRHQIVLFVLELAAII